MKLSALKFSRCVVISVKSSRIPEVHRPPAGQCLPPNAGRWAGLLATSLYFGAIEAAACSSFKARLRLSTLLIRMRGICGVREFARDIGISATFSRIDRGKPSSTRSGIRSIAIRHDIDRFGRAAFRAAAVCMLGAKLTSWSAPP
jgi:hypothetical protein